MDEKQNNSSWFAGIPGILVLLLIALAANYFHAWQISALFFLLLFLCVSSFFWSRGVLRRAALSVTASQGECYAGESLWLEVKVKNNSFFPLTWLDLLLLTGKRPLVRQASREKPLWYQREGEREAQTGFRLRFVWLLWQQEIIWKEELCTMSRGIVRLKTAILQAGDGLGLSVRERVYPLEVPVSLTIFPRTTSVHAQPFLKLIQEAAAKNRGQEEDITILKSSRPYAPGDPMKRINWRLLAAGGRMEVNVYENVMPGCMTFLLDLASFCKVVESEESQGVTYLEVFLLERDLERMISFAASCIREIASHQIQTALIIPGYGNREAVFCRLEGAEEALRGAMEALAGIDYCGEEVHFPYEDFWGEIHKLGSIYICTRTDAGSCFDGLAEELGRGRARYLVLRRSAVSDSSFECLCEEDICEQPLSWETVEEERFVERRIKEESSHEKAH